MYVLMFFIDFCVENLETAPSNFSSKFFGRSIYLQLLVIDVVFVHYAEPKEWSGWFMYYPCFFSLFSFVIGLFLDKH